MASNTAGDLIDFSYRRTEGLSDTLERKLGMFSVVIISLSAMLGTGLFVLPALVMVDMGGGTVPVSGIWLAYMLAALAILPAAVSKESCQLRCHHPGVHTCTSREPSGH